MSTEVELDVKHLWKSFYSDVLVLSTSVVVLLFSCIISVYIRSCNCYLLEYNIYILTHKLSFSYSLFLGLVISFSFSAGCTLCVVALQHKQGLRTTAQKFYEYLGFKPKQKKEKVDCDVCGVIKCNRHLTAPNREPWRGLFITRELDNALASVSIVIIIM